MKRSRVGPSPVQQQAGHTLLKQKSKRLLDTVLKRKMLVDGMKGYGDELRYNVALRSPNYGRKELSQAIEGLKALRQQMVGANVRPSPERQAHFQTQRGYSQPPTPRRPVFSADYNANYIFTSAVNHSGKSKPPILAVDSRNARPTCVANPPFPHSTTSARKAISNALSQSMNFKKFAQQNTAVPGRNNIQPDFVVPKSRIVPINVQKNDLCLAKTKETQRSTDPAHSEKCKSSAYLTMSMPSNGDGNVAIPIVAGRSAKIKTVTDITNRRKPYQNGLRLANEKTQRLVMPSKSDRSPSSTFRIKKISIATRPGDEALDTTRQIRNYVAGVKLYKPPPPSYISIDLESAVASNEESEPEVEMKIGKTLESEPPVKETQDIGSKSTDFVKGTQDVGTESTDFVKGMTLPSTQALRKSSFDFQNTPRANAYGKRSRNRSTFPRDGAPHRSSPATPNKTSSGSNESTTEEVITAPIKEQARKEEIPQFYFPKGKPRPKNELEVAAQKISDVCGCFENRMVPVEEMGLIAKACNLSLFWKGPLFHSATEGQNATEVPEEAIIRIWKRVTSANHDLSSRFVALLAKPGKVCLDFEDFLPLLKDIVDSHPGLIFLKDAPEFHTRYMNTVIARIFYVVNRSWSGQITASELRKSNFLTVLSLLEEEDDINAITDYFSYEHFYVIYCKFWELDTDHDLVIDKHDLLGYGDGVLSSRLIDRVLSGAVTRWDTSDHQLGKMSYVDFVWFILSEEDKKTPTSIEYWYRCMDLDGDGFISMYEMEYLYEEQSQKLEQLDIEPLPFEDCVCQIFDIVNPKHPGKVSLNDLKRCKMAHVFFDTFFNVAKYLNNEQKDPFVAQNALDGTLVTISDWDNFAAEEYDMLVAEEQSTKLTDLSNDHPPNNLLIGDHIGSLSDDERIDLLENRGSGNHGENSGDGGQLEHTKREDEIAAKLTELDFVNVAKPDPLVSLAQT